MITTLSTEMDVILFAEPLKTVGLALSLLDLYQSAQQFAQLRILMLLELTLAQTMMLLTEMAAIQTARLKLAGYVQTLILEASLLA